MSIFLKLRNILIILKIFYWFAFKATARAFLEQGRGRKAHIYWAIMTNKYFQTRMVRLSNQPRREGKTLVLANHRTQADFFIHNCQLDHSCNVLSRMIVGIVFFWFGIGGRETVWFFNRSGNINPDKFNEWLDKKFAASSRPSLLAYPQGHRMGDTVSVKGENIKTGMIKYAYRRRIPVQILMSFGNEKVFNEKKLHMSWGETIYYDFSKVLDPADYTDEKVFIEDVKTKFIDFFDHVHHLYEGRQEASAARL